MARKHPSHPEPAGTRERLLSTAQAAKYLGLKPRTLRTYIVKRLIPRRMIGKNLVFTVAELEALDTRLPLKRGRKPNP